MKKMLRRRMGKIRSFMAVALAMVIFASLFATGCGDLKWATDIDEVLELDAVFATNGTDLSIELSYESDIFSEKIDKDMVKVTSYQVVETDTTEEEEEDEYFSSSETEVSDFEVIYDSAKKITVNLGSSASNEVKYYVAVHSDATTVGEYADGIVDAYSEVEVTYSASIEGTYSVINTDPVFEITLENTTMVDNYTTDMVSFSGAFGDLEVDTISGSGNNIVVATTGSIINDTMLYGYVVLSSDFTNCGSSFSICVEVETLNAWVDESSYSLESGAVQFDLILGGDTFVSSEVTINGYTTMAVSEDLTTITLASETQESDIDLALDSISGNVITIDKSLLSSNVDAEASIFVTKASLIVASDYLVESDTTGEYSYQATIVAQNGSFGTITADDITFDDDFATLKDITLTESGNSYVLSATLVDAELDIDSYVLSGSMTVASGTLINKWGSASDNTTCEFGFSSVEDRSGVLDSIKDFISKNEDSFATLSTMGKIGSGVTSTVGGVKTVLELCGVVESTSDTLSGIRKDVLYTQQMVSQVSSKIDSLSKYVSDSFTQISSQAYQATYNTAALNWNSFLSNQATKLNNVISNYKQYYNEYMLSYIYNAHSTSMEIIIDSSGEVNITHPQATDETVDGKAIASNYKYIVANSLRDEVDDLLSGGRLTDDYWTNLVDYFTEDMSVVSIDGTEEMELSAESYLSAIQVNASNYAQSKLGASTIISAYTNFCEALSGTSASSPSSASSLKPLDYYNQMLEIFCNFYSENRADMEVMKTWLYSVMVESSGIATLALALTPSASATTVSTAYNSAKIQLSVDVGVESVKTGKVLSYVVGDYLSQGYNSYTYGTNNKWTNGVQNFTATKGNVVSSDQLKLMRSRYDAIKKAGGTTATSFGAYLSSFGLIKSGKEDCIFATSATSFKSFPLNHTVKLTCTSARDYFKKGSSYTIGTAGKYSSKYFDRHDYISGSFETMDGKTPYTGIGYYAHYEENHWWWSNHQFGYFQNIVATEYNILYVG